MRSGRFTWFSKEKGIDWHRSSEERHAILDKDRRFPGLTELERILEAIIFSSSKPITLKRLQKGLPEFTLLEVQSALSEPSDRLCGFRPGRGDRGGLGGVPDEDQAGL